MKLLLVADKEDSYIWDHFDPSRFADIDLILSCGDLKAEYLSFLVTMLSKPLLYVPGNHDKPYLRKPPEGCDSIDGSLITYNGLRIAGFGGSMRYNIGEMQYTEEEMAKRVQKVKKGMKKTHGVDLVITHAPAYGLGDGKDICHTGFKCFTQLIEECKPKFFIHGHNHMDYGRIDRKIQHGDTTVINAYKYYILDTDAPR